MTYDSANASSCTSHYNEELSWLHAEKRTSLSAIDKHNGALSENSI